MGCAEKALHIVYAFIEILATKNLFSQCPDAAPEGYKAILTNIVEKIRIFSSNYS
jgi:hypothetical protein